MLNNVTRLGGTSALGLTPPGRPSLILAVNWCVSNSNMVAAFLRVLCEKHSVDLGLISLALFTAHCLTKCVTGTHLLFDGVLHVGPVEALEWVRAEGSTGRGWVELEQGHGERQQGLLGRDALLLKCPDSPCVWAHAHHMSLTG